MTERDTVWQVLTCFDLNDAKILHAAALEAHALPSDIVKHTDAQGRTCYSLCYLECALPLKVLPFGIFIASEDVKEAYF